MSKPLLPEAYRYRLKGEPYTFYSPVDLRKERDLQFDEYMPLYPLQWPGDTAKLYELACAVAGITKVSAYGAQSELTKLRDMARAVLCKLEAKDQCHG